MTTIVMNLLAHTIADFIEAAFRAKHWKPPSPDVFVGDSAYRAQCPQLESMRLQVGTAKARQLELARHASAQARVDNGPALV